MLPLVDSNFARHLDCGVLANGFTLLAQDGVDVGNPANPNINAKSPCVTHSAMLSERFFDGAEVFAALVMTFSFALIEVLDDS